MPGLNQLKQFNKDIQSLGDELTIRASRGEKPVRVPIPRTVEDRDDSADFELGMPEIAAPVDNSSVDDDLSDITGISPAKSSGGEAEQAPSFEAPDMSSLLNPVMPDTGADMGMPDLSMFMDAPAAVEEDANNYIEEEPEEVAVADMGLEALLSGAGFDGSEGTGDEAPVSSNSDFYDDIEDLSDSEPAPAPEPKPQYKPADPYADLYNSSISTPSTPKTEAKPGDALDIDALFGTPSPEPVEAEPVDEIPEVEESLDFNTGDFAPLDLGGDSSSKADPFEVPADIPSFDDEGDDFNLSSRLTADEDADDGFFGGDDSFDTPAATDSFDIPEMSDMPDFDGASEVSSELDDSGSLNFDAPTISEDLEAPSFDDALGGDSFGSDSFDSEPAASEEFGSDGFGTDDFSSDVFGTDSSDSDNFGAGDFTTDGLDVPDFSDDVSASDSSSEESNLDMPDLGDDPFASGSSSFEAETPADENSPFAVPGGDLELGDEFGSSGGGTGFSFDDEIPDDEFNYEAAAAENQDEGSSEIDLSQIQNMEFETTDSQLESGGDFESGDFDSDFEIHGFTDVDAAEAVPKAGKKRNLDEPDFEGGMPGKGLPPNTLSDEQYKKFLKNLSEYPLNVRLAFENFIVQDEFTDDAEFEIIEKILNKAPARQVAANLEKMLDISIPVPRDFEHRTAGEYEAYKKSLAYQLKNRIIPFALLGMVLLVFAWGLFNFGKYCIVIPAQANSLYKQGYALLQADEYPQSEIKFDQAASKKMKKNWFFKYARGYREKKQYQRAGKMYKNILKYFNHDKAAGLEYADMALNDLADYAGAEDIIRREILDFHANDPDAQLLLGDVFLEWGTEKEPEKLELAKIQYTNLLNEAKNKKLINLYESRMMLYYIRTDNLAYVLPYKELFEPKEKNLSAADWTELSGYLLKKLYGPLAPSEEYLREKIEGLRKLLQRAVSMDPENPVALYNLGSYYVETNEILRVEGTFKLAIEKFNDAKRLKTRDIYKYIDSYRYLGENYVKTKDYLQAQEAYAEGLNLYNSEKEAAGFAGNEDIGHLYADLGDINYFASGDYDNAELNYQNAVDLNYDNSKIRYRLGYMQYIKNNYQSALGSFMKAGENTRKEDNLLLAMANTLSLRNDDYAAEGYYSQLIRRLNDQQAERGGSLYPQNDSKSKEIVSTYLYAANNYGVTLHRLAVRTGDSSKNAQAIVQFQQSERAWDALTRNQETMVRLGGSNLAEENIKYITHPTSDFEPAIYIDIPKTLTDNESL